MASLPADPPGTGETGVLIFARAFDGVRACLIELSRVDDDLLLSLADDTGHSAEDEVRLDATAARELVRVITEHFGLEGGSR